MIFRCGIENLEIYLLERLGLDHWRDLLIDDLIHKAVDLFIYHAFLFIFNLIRF